MRLTTERLLLREFVAGDWSAVLAYQRHPSYLQYYAWEDRTPAEVRRFIEQFLDQRAQQPRLKYQFAVTLKPENRLIGNCGIRLESADATEADIGYELDPQYWGHGYATEAAQVIVEFGFANLHLHRIWAECIAENLRSARVLERIGMQKEGRLRENVYFKGRWWDTRLYGMLDYEWAGTPPRKGSYG